jgi:quinol-cytochrome oxidoreductase complex cytochrome b subunit
LSENPGRRFVEWFKSRLGLKVSVLHPVPEYSMNPFYWLGALAVMAFGLQVLTGLLMLIYYVPTTDQAYSSTLYIIQYVPLGWLLETVHLYGAYAMILLAFLHLFRGYFVSAQKKPREMMWVVGMLMGLLVVGFGLTGYLLPWTVVSKSATDVSIGMLGFLPAQIGNIITFLIAGSGSSSGELTRFFDLHIIVLPAGLLSLIALKLYMFEAHGPSEPIGGAKETKEIPWFPTVYLYFAMVGSVFVAFILVVSSLFPFQLPAAYTATAAANYTPQPEWYFLWVYQLLKFASFEGSGIYFALGLVTLLIVGFVVLPFIDRARRRDPFSRPLYTTVGLIMIGELLIMTAWGYLTPGQVIPDVQAVEVLGTVALIVVASTTFVFRVHSHEKAAGPASVAVRALALPFTNRAVTAVFAVPLIVGSVCLANLVSMLSGGQFSVPLVGVNLAVLLGSFYAMARMMRSLTATYKRVRP